MNVPKDTWLDKPYYSIHTKLSELFGEKVYKLSLNGGMTCPNRDGTLGTRGCIFCSAGGSGDFAGDRNTSITSQIMAQKKMLEGKRAVRKYIAYFQAYTNTYAPLSHLKQVFTEAIMHPDIVGLSIGTRPDCLDPDIIRLLQDLNNIKPVWIELGLQTIHEDTARYIRRGYDLRCFDSAVERLQNAGLDIIVHTILGLPGEDTGKILQTIDYLNNANIQGIKLQLLHVLKNTDLASDYLHNKFQTMTMDEYIDLVITCLEHLSPQVVIHRLTGDGPKELLISPVWSSAKRRVLNELHHQMKVRNTWQGRLYLDKS